ncbi:MAG: hypothetical protein IPO94_09330 [Saprospiraceae bacterium]|nr:hypothetical protein [Saprospiraceae bacterium]
MTINFGNLLPSSEMRIRSIPSSNLAFFLATTTSGAPPQTAQLLSLAERKLQILADIPVPLSFFQLGFQN